MTGTGISGLLAVLALLLAGIVLVKSKGEDLTAWAVVALAVGLGAIAFLKAAI